MTSSGISTFAAKGGIAHFADRSILILLLAYPVLLLSVRGAMSTCLVLLLILSGFYLLRSRSRHIELDRGDLAFAAAMASPIVATLISQAYHKTFWLSSLDNASRFLFVIPIYFMLKRCPLSFPQVLEYGFPLGVLAAFCTSMIFPSIHWQSLGTYFVDPANFGAAVLLLGVLSLGTINWTKRDTLPLLALKLAAFVVSIYCALQTGERGVWIALPLLLCIWTVYRLTLPHSATIVAIAFVAALGSYWFLPRVSERIENSRTEVTRMLNGDFDSSVGTRLQIWHAAVEAISQNPLTGVGPTGPPDALRELSHQGQLTPVALEAGLSQIHNEILANTLRLGVFGLLSILAIYLVPLSLFLKKISSADEIGHRAAIMGVLFVTGYFIFGLTFEIFNIKMFATFYAVTVATLLAIVDHQAAAGSFRSDDNRADRREEKAV